MLKRPCFCFMLFFTLFASAQTPSAPVPSVTIRTVNFPQTLPELVALLPALIHDKQLTPGHVTNSAWFGPFTEAADKALHSDPHSATDAISALSKNLQDPDNEVQYFSLILLYNFSTVRPDYVDLVAPLSGQIAHAISSDDRMTQNAALSITLSIFLGFQTRQRQTPAIYIEPIEKLLLTKPCSDNTPLASGALMHALPTDETAQTDVLSVLNDTNCPRMVRWNVLFLSSNSKVGNLIVDNIVHTANTSDDIVIRDMAITGAKKIGQRALIRIADHLNQIVHDPSESSQSQKNAQDALNALAECQVTK